MRLSISIGLVAWRSSQFRLPPFLTFSSHPSGGLVDQSGLDNSRLRPKGLVPLAAWLAAAARSRPRRAARGRCPLSGNNRDLAEYSDSASVATRGADGPQPRLRLTNRRTHLEPTLTIRAGVFINRHGLLRFFRGRLMHTVRCHVCTGSAGISRIKR